MGKDDQRMRERYEKRADDPDRPRKYRDTYRQPRAKPPAQPVGAYQVVYILPGAKTMVWRTAKAPKTEWMLERAQVHKALFVTRYWPSKKGWRLLDVRQAQAFQHPGASYVKWVGHRFLDTIFPSEEAAVMAGFSLS